MTKLGGNSAGTRLELRVPGNDSVSLAWAGATDTGRRRPANEDSLITSPPVFAVADGMGGHSAGDRASDAVVTRLAEIAAGPVTTVRELEAALADAGADIDRIAGGEVLGVGTTVAGAALVLQAGDPCFVVFNIGDSRVYRLERHDLAQVTVDHSVVQELVDAGLIAPEDAEVHPDSNIITRAVGFGVVPQPDYWLLPVRPGLRLLVCSDGLNRELDHASIRSILDGNPDCAEAAAALVDAALEAGGRDNVSVIVVDVLEVPQKEDGDSSATAPISLEG